MRTLLLLSLVLSSLQPIKAETSPNNTGDQLQAFLFGYTPPSLNLFLPVQYTCPTPLLITALKPTNAGGPDPSAPYTMIAFVHEQLMDASGQRYEATYARSMNVGDMSQDRTFSHPWADGTQFIGCIWSVRPMPGPVGLVSRLTTGERSQRGLSRPRDDCTKPESDRGCVRDKGLAVPRAERHGVVGHKQIGHTCGERGRTVG